MADSVGSAHLRVTKRDGDALLSARGDDSDTEDYLTELKRFAAALNGLPMDDAIESAPPPVKIAAVPEPEEPPEPVEAPAEDAETAVAAPPAEPALPRRAFNLDESDEEDWWRELDARLARAPRRPLFAPRHKALDTPVVTHTAPPSGSLEPPPQLRRQIDPAEAASASPRRGRWMGWDRLDTALSAAGLTVVLLGAISSSAPRAVFIESTQPSAATIDLSVPPVRFGTVAAPPPAVLPSNDVVVPAAPAPPPFSVTLSLMSQSTDSPFLRPGADRAFGPVTLVNGHGPREAAPVVVASADMVDAEKADEFVPAIAPDPAVLGLAGPVELAGTAADIVSDPIMATPEPVEVAAPSVVEVAEKPEASPAPVAESTGGWLVHLASVRDESGAAPEWSRLSGQFEALKPLTLTVRQTDLGAKGEWYRIFAGPLESRAAARQLCASLSGQYCQPMPDKQG